jgi:pantoate--beta-alanine ligase
MKLLQTKADLLAWQAGRHGIPRVLVPTMGALHRGHTSLFDQARTEAGKDGDVIATIFVNPVQFGPNEDFDAYPRPLEADLEKCETHGVSAVFAPDVSEVYAADRSIMVTENRLSTSLCGASRPGHFDGVCTVVAKLFNLTRPDAAIFGEKDYQQLAVIRRLVRDLDFPVRIVAGPTVREDDGLALSSRNVYLSREQRAEAPTLARSLREVAAAIASGLITTPGNARQEFLDRITAASLARLDYFEIVDSTTLEPLTTFAEREPRLIAAAFFGKTRLIDNVGLPRD